MKTGLLPGIIELITILAVFLSFVPLALYWWKKLVTDKAYMFVAIFWTINGILYFPEIFNWNWYNQATVQITYYYNLVDGPIIIILFYYIFKKNFFLFLLGAFIIFEAVMIALKGISGSDTAIIGLGSLICLILNIWGISKYFMKIEHSDRENALVYVYSGFIFYYGLFAVVYIFDYLRPSGSEKPYVVFVNYSAIILATSLISYGFWKFAHTEYIDRY